VIEESMPRARVVVRDSDHGPVSRPDLAADLIRGITEPLRVAR
jgi:hypothetical protein